MMFFKGDGRDLKINNYNLTFILSSLMISDVQMMYLKEFVQVQFFNFFSRKNAFTDGRWRS